MFGVPMMVTRTVLCFDAGMFSLHSPQGYSGHKTTSILCNQNTVPWVSSVYHHRDHDFSWQPGLVGVFRNDYDGVCNSPILCHNQLFAWGYHHSLLDLFGIENASVICNYWCLSFSCFVLPYVIVFYVSSFAAVWLVAASFLSAWTASKMWSTNVLGAEV